ncbi:DUF6323 family protein [Eubacterium aggregans]|uniref:DUF6323 family protein n=1 Tax=Eubacterium aggregans TaxID=81409 RepID=UPI003F3EB485
MKGWFPPMTIPPFPPLTKASSDELPHLLTCNDGLSLYGYTLTPTDAKALIDHKNQCLVDNQRIEFGDSILKSLIGTFGDSPYLDHHNFLDTLHELTTLFYHLKSIGDGCVSDQSLLNLIKALYDGRCGGDLQYLCDLASRLLEKQLNSHQSH